MNVPRIQGLALMLSATGFIIGLLGPENIGVLSPQATRFFITVSVILFMLGIPGIHAAQPTGWMGLVGIALLELAALIALAFRFNMVPPSGFGDNLSLTSAIAGMLGAIIIGWLTLRERVFPAWVGWGFLAYGLLNMILGQFDIGGATGALIFFLPILQSAVLFAYGYVIFQKPAHVMANKYGAASD
jgi:hypothetical protein